MFIEKDRQLAQNICGTGHLVCTGWSRTSLQIGLMNSNLMFAANSSG